MQNASEKWTTDVLTSDLEPEETRAEEDEEDAVDDSDVEMDEERLQPRSDDDDTWVLHSPLEVLTSSLGGLFQFRLN